MRYVFDFSITICLCYKVDITGFREKTTIVKACAPEERLVGGGMQVLNMGELHGFPVVITLYTYMAVSLPC